MSAIAIVGPSGSGKSTSYGEIPEIGIKGLNPKETVVINVSGKDLPFKGWKNKYQGKITEGGNYYEGSDAGKISDIIRLISEKRPEIKNIVIDDAQYIMSFEFMKRAKESGYNKFTDIGVNIHKIAESSRNARKDLECYFMWHPETLKDGSLKMKSVGQMVDTYLTLEGLFSTILYTRVVKGTDDKIKYQFVTNNDGQFPGKSPVGMFKELYIPNDLQIVAQAINQYNN